MKKVAIKVSVLHSHRNDSLICNSSLTPVSKLDFKEASARFVRAVTRRVQANTHRKCGVGDQGKDTVLASFKGHYDEFCATQKTKKKKKR